MRRIVARRRFALSRTVALAAALLAGCAIAFAGAVVIGAATTERGADVGWGAAV